MDGAQFDLDRFVEAQNCGATYMRALEELRSGRKSSHWMWFVFPQLAGLGRSPTSLRYAISSLDEARAYLAHPVLGRRLVECAAAAAQSPVDVVPMLGGVDAQKLHSSMTLFGRAAPHELVFARVLDRHFGGVADDVTDQLLAAASRPPTEPDSGRR